ncbi:MAG: hypothetical protein H7288_06585 [Kineosporiaceae bacterium]|nr:hypothetical protein [Aeromicrobium sp.]
MTMTHEIDISSIFDLLTESDSVTQTLAPQPGTFVTTNAPFVPVMGTYVTVSHGAAPGDQVHGRYVSNASPVATADGSYVTSQLR